MTILSPIQIVVHQAEEVNKGKGVGKGQGILGKGEAQRHENIAPWDRYF